MWLSSGMEHYTQARSAAWWEAKLHAWLWKEGGGAIGVKLANVYGLCGSLIAPPCVFQNTRQDCNPQRAGKPLTGWISGGAGDARMTQTQNLTSPWLLNTEQSLVDQYQELPPWGLEVSNLKIPRPWQDSSSLCEFFLGSTKPSGKVICSLLILTGWHQRHKRDLGVGCRSPLSSLLSQTVIAAALTMPFWEWEWFKTGASLY